MQRYWLVQAPAKSVSFLGVVRHAWAVLGEQLPAGSWKAVGRAVLDVDRAAGSRPTPHRPAMRDGPPVAVEVMDKIPWAKRAPNRSPASAAPTTPGLPWVRI